MSDKKRKSAAKDGERPSKKQQTGSSVRVSHVTGPDIVKPVVASSTGVTFPDVKFQSYAKPVGAKLKLLLHSSEHSTLDYTAREDDNSVEDHLKHYVAVFDPEKGAIQVTEVKRLTVRSAIRSAAPAREEEADNETTPSNKPNARSALTQAFGTRKSKKAAQSNDENRLLAQGSGGTGDPVAAALLSSIADEDDDIKNEVSLADTLRNKPLPSVNLATNEIDQVYSLDALIHPGRASNTLSVMPIETWIENISTNAEVHSRFRFVANRVGYITKALLASPGEFDAAIDQDLRVLRYIQLLLDLYKYVIHLPRRRPIEHVDKWPENTMSEGTPMSLMRPIVNHFFPDRIPKEPSVTLLQTTILALTLHVPHSERKPNRGKLMTEPTDISMDMAIEANDVRKLYRELGCKVAPAKEADLSHMGLERLAKKRKDDKGLPKLTCVTLAFPLDFPKISRGRPSVRR